MRSTGSLQILEVSVQLAAALKRVGAQIVKEKATEATATLLLRVDPEQGEKWVAVITSFLLGISEKSCTADISKYFYVQQGAIRYLWRIVLTGDASGAISFLSSCALEISMTQVKELSSFPLVGRVRYPFDLTHGKLKGGYELEQAQAIVAQATLGVGGIA